MGSKSKDQKSEDVDVDPFLDLNHELQFVVVDFLPLST